MGISIRPPQISRPQAQTSEKAKSSAASGEAVTQKRPVSGHAFSRLGQGRTAPPVTNGSAGNAAPRQDVSKLKNLLAKFGPKPVEPQVELDPARHTHGAATTEHEDLQNSVDIANRHKAELRSMEGKLIATTAQQQRSQKMEDQGVELDPARHRLGAATTKYEDLQNSVDIANRHKAELRSMEGKLIATTAQQQRSQKMEDQGVELDPARHKRGTVPNKDVALQSSVDIVNRHTAELRSMEGNMIATTAQQQRSQKMEDQGVDRDPARHSTEPLKRPAQLPVTNQVSPPASAPESVTMPAQNKADTGKPEIIKAVATPINMPIPTTVLATPAA
jgi:hypothetical protein